MATEKDLLIRVAADVDQAVMGLNKVQSELKETGKKATTANKRMTAGAKKTNAAFGKLAKQAAAVFSVAAVAGFTRAAVRAFQVQEDSVNKLTSALEAQGVAVDEALPKFEALASAWQAQSRFGDEQIMQAQALGLRMGVTADKTAVFTEAVLNLAAAQGKSLEESTRQVAKTMGGFAGELGELLPEIKDLTKEQLQAGEALDLIADKFKNAAARDVQTFSGAIQQASNAWGDFLEKMGSVIGKSETVVEALNFITKTLTMMTAAFDGFFKAVGAVIEGIGLLAQVAMNPLRLIREEFRTGLVEEFQQLSAEFGAGIADMASSAVQAAAPSVEQAGRDLAKVLVDTGFKPQVQESMAEAFDPSAFSRDIGAATTGISFGSVGLEGQDPADAFGFGRALPGGEQADPLSGFTEALGMNDDALQSWMGTMADAGELTGQIGDTVKDTGKQFSLGQKVTTQLGGAFGNLAGNIAQAALSGEKNLKEFAAAQMDALAITSAVNAMVQLAMAAAAAAVGNAKGATEHLASAAGFGIAAAMAKAGSALLGGGGGGTPSGGGGGPAPLEAPTESFGDTGAGGFEGGGGAEAPVVTVVLPDGSVDIGLTAEEQAERIASLTTVALASSGGFARFDRGG